MHPWYSATMWKGHSEVFWPQSQLFLSSHLTAGINFHTWEWANLHMFPESRWFSGMYECACVHLPCVSVTVFLEGTLRNPERKGKKIELFHNPTNQKEAWLTLLSLQFFCPPHRSFKVPYTATVWIFKGTRTYLLGMESCAQLFTK